MPGSAETAIAGLAKEKRAAFPHQKRADGSYPKGGKARREVDIHHLVCLDVSDRLGL